MLLLVAFIGKRQLLDLRLHTQRHKMQHTRAYLILRTRDTRVVQTMTTFVTIQRSLARLPSRIPNRLSVFHVEITSDAVHRHAVVTITGNAAELSIFVEIITASGIRDQTEKVLVTQIVNPRKRSPRISDNILTMSVIKMSVFVAHKTM